MRILRVFYRPNLPYVVHFLRRRDASHEYSIGVLAKVRLVLRIRRNVKRIETLSTWLEHLELASAILQVPPSIEGDVIECGCYKGGSTANLSLVCSLVGRRLVVCDSFEGLPEPGPEDREHFSVHTQHTDVYEQGRFAASLEEVRDNIARYGEVGSCEFVKGFFEDTLHTLDGKYVMAFLDVDLVASLKSCLTAIWPNLQEGCRVFVHEARSLSFVALFFDTSWWQEHLHEEPPGFVGAGTGLPLDLSGSELGYAQKGVRTFPVSKVPEGSPVSTSS